MLKTASIRPRYFIGLDYDGTAFETSQQSPNGINVEHAYYLALEEIFGIDMANVFKEEGLRNRAPLEIIHDLLYFEYDEPEVNKFRDRYIGVARLSYMISNNQSPSDYSPEDDAWKPENVESTLTNFLVEKKLGHLMKEVGEVGKDGKIWPQPCEDFSDFFRTAHDLHDSDYPIDIAIISSGHEPFIRKTFKIWELPQPHILVTDDDIRDKKYPLEKARRVKPGPLPLAIAHQKWRKQQQILPLDFVKDAEESRRRMMYIGDSFGTDIRMAIQSGVHHAWYPRTSFSYLTESLWINRNLMDGRPISEILPPRPHSEIEGIRGLRQGERV